MTAEIDQPGLGRLREAVANRPQPAPGRTSLRQDAVAGLGTAISDVPDGMATALLAGVNPIHGLYAAVVGPIVGGLRSSTGRMVITTTSAAALAAGEALVRVAPEDRAAALFLMVILVGAIQVALGLLRLGRLTRFVSYSVMSGLLMGIAVLIVLSQLPTVTGYAARGDGTMAATRDLLANADKIHLPTLGVAILAIALAVGLRRTRLGGVAALASIVVPSAVVALVGLESVRIVADIGDIPRGIPTPFVPSLAQLSTDLVLGALAVAIIILVQGAGVSQTVPNLDGSRRSISRDFIAQGAANLAAGVFRGLPVGGSLGATALGLVSGAGSRWAPIFSGVWVAVIVLLLPGLVSYIAMPTLGALLIVASAGTIKLQEAVALWRTGWPSRLASAATFLSTLFLPIQVAVGIGVALSAVLYLGESAADVTVVELVVRPDGSVEERRPARRLPSSTVTVLDIYGHLFFAGARTLERLLPVPGGAKQPVVVLRLRGRTTLGATLIEMLSDYAEGLEAADGRLYLSGLSPAIHDQIRRSSKLALSGPVRAYEATAIRGHATQEAVADAQAWLVGLQRDGRSDPAS